MSQCQPHSQPQSQSAVAHQSTYILKLHVRIQDKVLLVPVECNKSVQWLTEEVARRYYNMTGLNPVLSLQTQDGAVLNGDDIVNVILQDGDKVVSKMLKWDLQPLPERYSNLCRQLQTGFSILFPHFQTTPASRGSSFGFFWVETEPAKHFQSIF